MKITDEIKKNQLKLTFSGHGHYKVSGMVYGKYFYYTESDMTLVDDYHDDNDRKSNGAARKLLKKLRNNYRN